MRNQLAALGLLATALSGCAAPVATDTVDRANNAPPAGRWLRMIPDVPFIGWREASLLDYHDKRILNPSFAAALGMILKYWGQDLSLLKWSEDALRKGPGGWGQAAVREGASIDELKAYVDRGIPVLVSTAATPVAHTLSPVHFFVASTQGFKFEAKGVQSGIIGRMVSLDTFRRLEEQLKVPPTESLLVSARVVIGYNDRRRVLVFHDPSFGPAFEIGFEAFEAMWGGVWRKAILVAYPDGYTGMLATRPPAPAYPTAAPDQRATAAFVRGYALSSVGRVAEGEATLSAGLRIPGISRGMRHLLLFELALHRWAQGRVDEAIRLAEEAGKLVPEHHRPWEFLADAYRANPLAPDERRASHAEQRREQLCADAAAQQAAQKALGDLFFFLFAGCR